MRGAERADAGLVEQCGASLRVSVSISRASSRSSASVQHASGERASASRLPRSSGRSPVGSVAARREQPCPCQRPQLGPQRLRAGDEQVAQLAEAGRLGVDRAFPAAIKARSASRSPPARGDAGRSLREHGAGRADRVERVRLAARAALPPQTADLEHPLTAAR